MSKTRIRISGHNLDVQIFGGIAPWLSGYCRPKLFGPAGRNRSDGAPAEFLSLEAEDPLLKRLVHLRDNLLAVLVQKGLSILVGPKHGPSYLLKLGFQKIFCLLN